MADSNQPQQQQHQQLNGLSQVSEVVVPTVQISTNGVEDENVVEEVSEELLQQALGVGVSTFQQDGVSYQAVDGVVSVVTHGEVLKGTELVANVVEEDDTVATLVQQVEAVAGEGYEVPEYAVSIVDDTVSAEQIEELTNSAENMCESAMIVAEDPSQELEQTVMQVSQDDSLNNQTFTLLSTNADNKETLRVTLMPTNASSGAPLGSSQNPIRIIQQGNQYTPVQQLSNDQLSQIMQVVQQQQVTKTAQEGGGSSTLYNPDTNTKIVYRVIYPSELHKTTGDEPSQSVVTQSQGQQTLTLGTKRPYKKRRLEDEEDKATDVPDLSREEKDARKKHRPRTRSGRVSKPPKHMIKDYKHIHTVDWDEDPYDDSDGGYSDFKYSEDERDNEDSNDLDFSTGIGSGRPKNWRCASCEKGYIGQAGLDRHYRLNPEHAKGNNTAINTSVSNGLGFSGQFSEDSNTQDSNTTANSNNNTSATNTTTTSSTPLTVKHGRGNYRNVSRGPWGAYKTDALKRKRKLKEFLRYCTDEDLMETVLPRLSKVITLWEFLLAKIEKGNPSRPHVTDIYREFSTLHKKVESVCKKYLIPLSPNQQVEQRNRLQIDNAAVANSLGLEVKTYCAKPIDINDETFHRQATKPVSAVNLTNHSGSRSINLISKEDLIGHSNKRFVINAPETMTTCSDGLQVVKVAIPPVTTSLKAATAPFVSSKSGGPNVSLTASQPVRPQTSLLRQAFKQVTPVQGVNQGINSRTHLIQNTNQPTAIKSETLLHTVSKPQSILTDSTMFLSKPVSTNGNTVLTNSNLVPVLNSNSSQITIQNIPLSMASSLPPHTPISQQSLLPTSTQSTQITIPVMLPQGTEQISLELPSSLAQTMINTGGIVTSLPQTMCTGSATTTTTTAAAETPMVIDSGALVDNSVELTVSEAGNSESVQSFVTMSTEEPGKSQVFTVEGLGDVELPAHIDPNNITQFIQHDGELTAFTNGAEVLTEDQLVEGQVISGSNIYQTEDGIFIIQSPNGTTLELQGAQSLPIETVQALFAMDTEGQSEQSVLQVTEFEDLPCNADLT